MNATQKQTDSNKMKPLHMRQRLLRILSYNYIVAFPRYEMHNNVDVSSIDGGLQKNNELFRMNNSNYYDAKRYIGVRHGHLRQRKKKAFELNYFAQLRYPIFLQIWKTFLLLKLDFNRTYILKMNNMRTIGKKLSLLRHFV